MITHSQASAAAPVPSVAIDEFVQPDRKLIRLVRAAADEPRSVAALCDTLTGQLASYRQQMLDHGGLLLRGYDIQSAADFEQLADVFLTVQESYIGGVSHRSRIHNNVYNTTDAPANMRIEQHLEATHTPRPPQTILFNCQRAASSGGETPLASFIELFDALPAAITDTLLQEKILYTRQLIDREGALFRSLPKRVTTSLALSWQEVSGCDDYTTACERLRAEGYDVRLRPRQGLETVCVQPLISAHPVTGRLRWYLSDQITRVLPWYTRLPRYALRRFMGMEFSFESGRVRDQGLFEQVHRTLEELRFAFRWQPGDVLVLDNEQMSHGRSPFAGERLILTAFG